MAGCKSGLSLLSLFGTKSLHNPGAQKHTSILIFNRHHQNILTFGVFRGSAPSAQFYFVRLIISYSLVNSLYYQFTLIHHILVMECYPTHEMPFTTSGKLTINGMTHKIETQNVVSLEGTE